MSDNPETEQDFNTPEIMRKLSADESVVIDHSRKTMSYQPPITQEQINFSQLWQNMDRFSKRETEK